MTASVGLIDARSAATILDVVFTVGDGRTGRNVVRTAAVLLTRTQLDLNDVTRTRALHEGCDFVDQASLRDMPRHGVTLGGRVNAVVDGSGFVPCLERAGGDGGEADRSPRSGQHPATRTLFSIRNVDLGVHS
jgi:hypothetical protein